MPSVERAQAPTRAWTSAETLGALLTAVAGRGLRFAIAGTVVMLLYVAVTIVPPS